jgi:hypothetical protein
MNKRITTKLVLQMLPQGGFKELERESFIYNGPLSLAAAPADYLDWADLASIDADGFVNEDLIQEVFDSSTGIQPVIMPMLTTVPVSNAYKSWPQDELEAPADSRVVSGADAAVVADSLANAIRLGNHAQTNRKVVNVTTRARNVSAVTGDVLEYRTRRRILELFRDMETHLMGVVGSVEDDNNATAGRTAALGAFLTSHVLFGAGGSAGGFQTGTKLVDDITGGTAFTPTLTNVRDIVQGIYEDGGASSGELIVTSTPGVIKSFSEAVRTDSSGNFVSPVANIAGDGKGVNQTAQGWTDHVYTDFGIKLRLVPNRLQLPYDPTTLANDVAETNAVMYFLDTEFLAKGFLHDVRVEPLAKLGLSDRRQISADWMSLVLLERAMGAIYDIDVAAPF